jgi:IS5 family transposase
LKLSQVTVTLVRVPDLAVADAGFFSAANEAKAKELGVKRVAVPSRSTKSEKRQQEQKKRWFKKAQKWRTGCEGRNSVLKRRLGLNRSRYKGASGMKRWVLRGTYWRGKALSMGIKVAS